MDSNSSSDSEEVDRYDPAQDSQSEESDYGSDKEFETKKASIEKDVFTETIKEDNQKKIDAAGLTPFTGTSLPYELSSLTWDRSHRTNTSNMYCYCANPKTRDSVMLHCVQCKQWFHVECCKSKIKNPPVFGDWAYIFKCCICNNDNEYFEQIVKNWTDIVRVAIYNLIYREKLKGSDKKFFQYKEQICAFIDRHWDQLCFGKSRTKTWENTIGSALSTKSNYFLSGNDVIGAPGYWSLRDEDDPSITKESGTAKPFGAPPKAPKEKKRKSSKPPSGNAKGGKKKKTETGEKPAPNPEVKSNKKKAIPLPVLLPKMPFHPKTYKYEDICLAKENSAPQIKISTDRNTASNDKGYRMARASFGVTEGAWYFEVKVQPHSGNTRLGWSTEKGDVQAPVGYDKYSYSYRDKEGTKFHQSRGTPYGLPYGPGDVIGFHIYLPPKPKEEKKEEAPKIPSKVEEPKVLPGSSITFFKNGVSQGVAFKDIFEGTYYPAASLYMGGVVKFNFGPTFQFPPNLDCKAVCEVIELVLQEPDPNAAIMASYMNPEPATPVTPTGETSSQPSSEVKAETPAVPSTLETNMQT